MAKIDLNTNRDSLLRAYKEVSNVNSSTNWALFSYEGKTPVLKLQETGDGGIEEMLDELNSGRIMYAYIRVTDPNTNLPKFVFVNWQGEGVPEMRKGSCANHVTDVSNFFKGVHLTVNARTEDDIDEEDILNKVAKSSGSNYSFHKEQPKRDESSPGPVGSVYKRTLPQKEIQSRQRDQFWTQQKQEEDQRRKEEGQKLARSQSIQDEERKEREALEAREREKREGERVQKIRVMKEAEKKANAKVKDTADLERQQAEALRDAEERSKRSDMMRKQRAAEAKALIGQRGDNPRNLFEQSRSQFDKPAVAPPPSRKIRRDFLPGNESATSPTERKAPITLPTDEPEGPPEPITRAPSKPSRGPPSPRQPEPVSPPPQSPPAAPIPRRQSPPRAAQPPPSAMRPPAASAPPPRQPSPPRKQPSPPPQQPRQPAAEAPPGGKSLLAGALPPRQRDSDSEAEDDDWGDDAEAPKPQPVMVQEEMYDDIHQPNTQQDDIYDDAANPASNHQEEIYDDAGVTGSSDNDGAYDQTVPTADGDKGQCARALYDYQAAEENEISFDPDDLITNIEFIDSGWWIGVGPDGRSGMFPANYVELFER